MDGALASGQRLGNVDEAAVAGQGRRLVGPAAGSDASHGHPPMLDCTFTTGSKPVLRQEVGRPASWSKVVTIKQASRPPAVASRQALVLTLQATTLQA